MSEFLFNCDVGETDLDLILIPLHHSYILAGYPFFIILFLLSLLAISIAGLCCLLKLDETVEIYRPFFINKKKGISVSILRCVVTNLVAYNKLMVRHHRHSQD